MTDSESDELSNTVLRFQNQSTRFHVRGPHVNSTVMSGRSFGHNNILTSTMNSMNHLHVPTNIERPRCVQSWDSRSRRGTSPMSVTSASGMQSINQYPGGGFGSRSVYGGRAGSPSMSMRSFRTMDSTTSAADIANAIESLKFNKFDLRIIKEALYKQMKQKDRRRVEKRRNARFTKIARRRISGDSGDRASDSSLSDDNKSVQSSRTYRSAASFRSTRTDFHKLTNSNDRLNNFQNNSHRSFYPSSRSCKDTLQVSCKPAYMEESYSHTSQRDRMDMYQRNMYQTSSMINNSVSTNSTSQKHVYKSKPVEVQNKSSTVTLKERFQGLLPAQRTNMLPAQRFNQSSTRSLSCTRKQAPNSEEQGYLTTRKDIPPVSECRESLDEQDDIFVEITDIGKETRKRNLNCEDATFPSEKKSKVSSPKATKSTTNKSKDFVFVKPQFPISRLSKAKNVVKPPKSSPKKQAKKSPKPPKNPVTCSKSQDILKADLRLEKSLIPQTVPEILISKCTQSLDASTALTAKSKITEQPMEIDQEQSVLSQDTTDVSMKPSFIKRKLFTQKVDVPDKNSSSDSLQSPSSGANMYSGINKEKHKTRKIVTSQSCLSRDFLGDDSNLLDLIHKIVPPDRMNLTSANNHTEMQSTIDNKNRPTDNTSATKDDGNISDTFTDEEIFSETVNEKSNNKTVVNTKQNNDTVNVNRQRKNVKIDVKTKESNNKAVVTSKHEYKSDEKNYTAGNNELPHKTNKNKKDTPIKLNSTASVHSRKTKKATPIKKNGLFQKNASSKQKNTKQTSLDKEPVTNEKLEKEIVNQTSMRQTHSVTFKKHDDTNITQPTTHKDSLSKHRNVDMMPTDKDTGVKSPENIEFRGFNLRKNVLRYWDSDLESDFELERRTPMKPVGGQRSHPISFDKTSTVVVKTVQDAVAKDATNAERSSKMSDNTQATLVVSDNVSHLTNNQKSVTNFTEKRSRNNKPVNTEVSQKKPQEKINSIAHTLKKPEANEKENVQPKNASTNKVQHNKCLIDKNSSQKPQGCKNAKGKKSKINNNALRFKSQNQTETDTLDKRDAHYLSLRSRAVNLSLNDSTTPKKTKSPSKNNKVKSSHTNKFDKTVGPSKSNEKVESVTSKKIEKLANKNTKTNSKTVEKPIKDGRAIEKTDTKKTAAIIANLKKLSGNDQSVLSDLSFTLTSEITNYKKSSKTKPAETFTKTRASNISFALLKDEPVAAKRTTRSQSILSDKHEITQSNRSRRAKGETTKPAPIAAKRRTRSESRITINRDVTITSKNKITTSSKDITSKPASINSRNSTKTNSKANLNTSREVLLLIKMSSNYFATSSKRIPSKPTRYR